MIKGAGETGALAVIAGKHGSIKRLYEVGEIQQYDRPRALLLSKVRDLEKTVDDLSF